MAGQIEQSYIFGFNEKVSQPLAYRDDFSIVYPVGHSIVEFNTDSKDQTIVNASPNSSGITALAFSPNKRFTAIAETLDDRASISVYDWKSGKKRGKTISNLDLGSRRIEYMSFTSDGKSLVVQGGAPDWSLVVITWEKAKVTTHTKGFVPPGSKVNQVDQCPNDPTLLLVSGDGFLKLYRATGEDILKSVPLNFKRAPQNYTCHAWLHDDSFIVGTDTGELLLFEGSEFRTVLASSPGDGRPIGAIRSFLKGFLVGGDNATLRLYERSEDPKELYTPKRRFRAQGEMGEICAIAISSNEDGVTVATRSGQLYELKLSLTEMTKDEVFLSPLIAQFHGPDVRGNKSIVDLDACVRKSLVASVGVDRCLRVWSTNAASTARPQLEVSHTFDTELHSVAFHPSGLHVLVGTDANLQLLNVLNKGVHLWKDINIKCCPVACFSSGGHRFAAASSAWVLVYDTYSGRLLHTLRSHSEKVTAITWCKADKVLVTAGMDGAIISWNMADGAVLRRRDLPGTVITGIAPLAIDGGSGGDVMVVGHPAEKEGGRRGSMDQPKPAPFMWLDMLGERGEPRLEVDLEGLSFNKVVASRSTRMLFVSSDSDSQLGLVRSYKCGPSVADFTGDYIDYLLHGARITAMCISWDGRQLFTGSADGSIALLNLSEGRMMARRDRGEHLLGHSEEVLMEKLELAALAAVKKQLEDNVRELELHSKYQENLKKMQFAESLREMEEKLSAELETERQRVLGLKQEKSSMESSYDERIAKLEKDHGKELSELESVYKAKITAEIQRYDTLVKERETMNAEWDKRNASTVASHEKHVEEMKKDYEKKLDDEERLRTKLEGELKSLESAIEKKMDSLERDADTEIGDVKSRFEGRLKEEAHEKLLLQGENAIMKTKRSHLYKDIANEKEEVRALKTKEVSLKETIAGLEKDIKGHRKEIREREETIADKDKRIYDLRKKNQELEKFKFVLNYKIQELNRQIKPRKKEIEDMQEQIKEMELELLQYHKSHAALNLMISELRLKQDGLDREVSRLEDQLREKSALLQRIRDDLHKSNKSLGTHKALKIAVTKLYDQYINVGVKGEVIGTEAERAQREFSRRREYLEATAEGLKRKLEKDNKMITAEKTRLLRENTALVDRINALRRQLKYMKREASALEQGTTLADLTFAPGDRSAGARSMALSGKLQTGPIRVANASEEANKSSTLGALARTIFQPRPPPLPRGKQRAVRKGPTQDEEAQMAEIQRDIEMQQSQIRNLRAHLSKLREIVEAEPGLGKAVAEGHASAVRPASRDKLPPVSALAQAGRTPSPIDFRDAAEGSGNQQGDSDPLEGEQWATSDD